MKSSIGIIGYFCVLILFIVSCNLNAIYPLTRTYSIKADTLNTIRNAISVNSPDALIRKYWLYDTRSQRDELPDSEDIQRDRDYTDTFGFEGLSIETFTAVVDFNSNPDDNSDILDRVRSCLFSFPWTIYQNSIKYGGFYLSDHDLISVPADWDTIPSSLTGEDEAWWELTHYQRARELSYNLMLMSYIADMLYYAHDRSDTTTMAHMQYESIMDSLQAHVTWIHESFFNYGMPNSPVNGWDSIGWNIYDLYEAGDPPRIAPKGMCEDSNETGGGIWLPQLVNGVSRFHLICGMGYASIITEQDTMLNEFVKNEFTSTFQLPAETPFYGFNDYLTTNSGMYTGGITYQNRLLYLSNLFFTALNRVKGINLYNTFNSWNCDVVPRMVKNTMRRIDPELQHITQEDDWRYNGITSVGSYNSDIDHSIQIERGLLSFFYQNTDDFETRDAIRWYVNVLHDKCGEWPREVYEHDFVSSFEVVMNYRDYTYGCSSITSNPGIPSFISNGSYSDEELTILRNPDSRVYQNGYKNSNMLVVNHENSFTPYHHNRDATSFQLYLWGKPVVIESGYTPYGSDGLAKYMDWHQSAYSHNVLLINPDQPECYGSVESPILMESDYLSRDIDNGIPQNEPDVARVRYEDPQNFSWPISWLKETMEDHTEGLIYARKQYVLSNNELEKLQVRIKYNNVVHNNYDPTNPDQNIGYNNAYITRNFYRYSDKCYFIYDVVDNGQIPNVGNIYRNQMFLVGDIKTGTSTYDPRGLRYPPYFDNLNHLGVSHYMYTGNRASVYICMGSSVMSESCNVIDDEADETLKLAWKPRDWEGNGDMCRVSLQTYPSYEEQVEFLSVLYPKDGPYSQENSNPVRVEVRNNSQYGVLLYDENILTAIAIASRDSVCFADSLKITTDAQFVVMQSKALSSEPEFVLLNGGSFVSMEGMASFPFPRTHILDVVNDEIEEMSVVWKGEELYVTTKSFSPLIPKYRVNRYGLTTKYIHSKTEYGSDYIADGDTITSPRGTIADNIISLAYDETYFYVNYSWGDLMQQGLVESGKLTIVKGTIPQIDIGSTLTLEGDILITGTVTIRDAGCLNINPGADLRFEQNCGILCYGILNITGADSDIALRSYEITTPWEGITVFENGNFSCHQGEISNANTGISINGSSDIIDSQITNCTTGIDISSAVDFRVDNCLIQGNTTGLLLSNNYTSVSSYVAKSEFTENNVAISVYNSNTFIEGNNIHHNTSNGMYLVHNSEPLVTSNQVTMTESSTTVLPEITLACDSYPVIDYGYNDINADGYGTSLFYSDSGGRPHSLKARNNYWGSTNSTAIAASIIPSIWDVDYNPFSLEPNTSFVMPQNDFNIALDAEENGNLPLAVQIYTSLAVNEPDSLYALQSLGRLNSIYAYADTLISNIRTIYNNYMVTCTDSLLLKSAAQKFIMLDRFDKFYPCAIQSYENLLYDASNAVDSLLCLLDISYTMQEMYGNDEGKGIHSPQSYQANGISITNIKEAKYTISNLWRQLLAVTHESLVYIPPSPYKLEVGNYPNPFNPNTTVTFTLPATATISINIYNIKGQKVRELIRGEHPRGFHKTVWDGKDDTTRSVGSGIYFLRLESAGTTALKKIMLMK